MSDYISTPQEDYEQTIANFNLTNVTMTDIETAIEGIIHNIPVLDRASMRKEMAEMVVTVPENPTTYEVTQGLAKCQGYRDRLTEMYFEITKEVKIRKRCLEMLFDANNLISKASSVDKRKGEATLKYPMYLLQYESADAFLKEVELIMANMKATFDTYSRIGSIMALQVQLGERKAFDKDFNNFNNEEETTIKELDWV